MLKLFCSQISNTNGNLHRKSSQSCSLPKDGASILLIGALHKMLLVCLNSDLLCSLEGRGYWLTLIQIYYGRTNNCFITAGREGDSEWNLGVKSHLMLNFQPYLLRGQLRHQVEKEVILSWTAGCWNSVPSDWPINSTLQEQAKRGHRFKQEVLGHLFISLSCWFSSSRHVY